MPIGPFAPLQGWLRRLGRPQLTVYHHPDYRLPITSLDARARLDPRRADLAAWCLRKLGAAPASALRRPEPAPLSALLRAHDADYLEGLLQPGALARIFGVDGWDLPIDEVWRSLRLITGGTLEAARAALDAGGHHQLNLAGGMHHAARTGGGGFCPVNDVAVAVLDARDRGLTGPIVVLDLDFHPPDGTADCLRGAADVWLGSISGADWGPLPGVDETVLPPKAGPEAYQSALLALLSRMPARPSLAIVIAGGDVALGDPLGDLGLDEPAMRARDLAVMSALHGVPAVFLPGGGYGPTAWRAIAGLGLALATGGDQAVPATLDPLQLELDRVWRSLQPAELTGDDWISAADLAGLFGPPDPAEGRLLGHYSPAGLELALSRYGLLDRVRRLGYQRFTVRLDHTSVGERMRLFGQCAAMDEVEHLLVELVVERCPAGWLHPALNGPVLFVHWLTLRHPLAHFRAGRGPLPGQEVPGLGMAREATALLSRMARRLDLLGVAVRPAYLHIAAAANPAMRFLEPARQAAFLVLLDAIAAEGLTLPEATRRLDEGTVTLNGAPYAWTPDLLVRLAAEETTGPPPAFVAAVEAARGGLRFSFGR